MAVVEADV